MSTKKVLILAYDFPPYVSVGGLRPFSWYKYFNEFGVYPIVITRQWDNKHGNYLDYISPSESAQNITEEGDKGTIIRTPYFPNFANKLMLKYGDAKYKFFRKAFTAYFEFAQFLFFVGPKSSLYFAAEEYLKKNKVDVILTTGDPFVLFNYASKLSAEFKIPWIADYRDPWSQKITIQNKFLLKNWHTRFEKKLVSTSSVITTVSELMKNNISSVVKNKKVYVLPNGFDPEVIESVKGIEQQSEILSIALIGSIYDWHPIKSFLSVISDFLKKEKGRKIRLNFYGINFYAAYTGTGLSEIIASDFPELLDSIVINKKMDNTLLAKELAEQNVMLLFNDYSILGTKIFDYIGIKRKILLCYSTDAEAAKLKETYYPIEEVNGLSKCLQEDLINETGSGIVVKDAKHLTEILTDLYSEFEETRKITCNTVNIEKYSRKNQVKELSQIIKDMPSPIK